MVPAVGRCPGTQARRELATALDTDTVDEVVTVMYPRQVRPGRCAPLPAAIRLTATDAGRSWTLELRLTP